MTTNQILQYKSVENPIETQKYNILLIEDNPGDERLFRELIAEVVSDRYHIFCAKSLAEGTVEIAKNNLDVILLDLSLPDSQGLETFYRVQEAAFDLPIIVMTGLNDENAAMLTVEKGAQDYLVKGTMDGNSLNRSIKYAIKRKQMEEQLQLLATAMYAASNVVFITDRNGVIEWINPAFTQITGYTANEAIGNTPSFLKSGLNNKEYYTGMWQTILSGQVWNSEVTNRRKDGSLYVVEQTITPFSGHSREITHFVAIQQDITERKKADENQRLYLREIEALLVAASTLRKADSSPEALSIMLDQTLKALDLSAGYISVHDPVSGRLSRKISRGWFESWDNIPMTPDERIAEMVFSSGQTFVADEFQKVDLIPLEIREPFPAEWGGICTPIRSQNAIEAVMVVSCKLPRRITPQEIKLLESMSEIAGSTLHRLKLLEETQNHANQLAQRVAERTAELSRALRVKDEFLANMSHELRTPLNAILGLSESLAEQTAGPLNDKQQRYVATINESGNHLLSLINDILDLAKIEAGQIKLDLAQVDVTEVCQASLRIVKQLAQKKNIQIGIEIDSKITPIYADERRLKQMLVNLLSNAIKFTPNDRTVGLDVRSEAEAGLINFTVWDTGIGIRKDDHLQVFQPFVQLDGKLERENSGTGLGLALVAQMAGLHGGSIQLTSELGKGSRFTITLPLKPIALSPLIEKSKKNTGRLVLQNRDPINRPTILLVEDVKDVSWMIQEYLEYEGFKVIIAEDGVEGVDRAKTIYPDLILMDIQMPRLNGIDAARLLRGDSAFEHTPIIALTALAMSSDRERCLEAGMNAYISKPINLKNLVKTIQEFLADKFSFVPADQNTGEPAP